MKTILSSLNREFATLDGRSRELLHLIAEDLIFARPREIPNSMSMFSCGEYILRSAAMVEKTFGGITTRLWDDPFEWTLPENLSGRHDINRYLDEVEQTRALGFDFFTADADLARELPAPREMRPLIDVLIETIARAEHFQGRAFAVFQMLSDEKLPRL
ncbi:hypothetical protein BH20ACI2_BH20ACI2_05400 [soil metagenome]